MRTPHFILATVVTISTACISCFCGSKLWADDAVHREQSRLVSPGARLQTVAESPQIFETSNPLRSALTTTTGAPSDQHTSDAPLKRSIAPSLLAVPVRKLKSIDGPSANLSDQSNIRLIAALDDQLKADQLDSNQPALQQPARELPKNGVDTNQGSGIDDEMDFEDDLPEPPRVKGSTAGPAENSADMNAGSESAVEYSTGGDPLEQQYGYEDGSIPCPECQEDGSFPSGPQPYGANPYGAGPYGAEMYAAGGYGAGPIGAGPFGGPGQHPVGPGPSCTPLGIWWEATAPQEMGLSSVVRQIELQPGGRYNEVIFDRSGVRVDVVIGSFLLQHGELTLLVQGMPLAEIMAREINVGGQPRTVVYRRGSSGPYVIAFSHDCSQLVLTDAGGASRVWMRYPPPRFGVPTRLRGYYALGRPGYQHYPFPWLPDGESIESSGARMMASQAGLQVPTADTASRQAPLGWSPASMEIGRTPYHSIMYPPYPGSTGSAAYECQCGQPHHAGMP